MMSNAISKMAGKDREASSHGVDSHLSGERVGESRFAALEQAVKTGGRPKGIFHFTPGRLFRIIVLSYHETAERITGAISEPQMAFCAAI